MTHSLSRLTSQKGALSLSLIVVLCLSLLFFFVHRGNSEPEIAKPYKAYRYIDVDVLDSYLPFAEREGMSVNPVSGEYNIRKSCIVTAYSYEPEEDQQGTEVCIIMFPRGFAMESYFREFYFNRLVGHLNKEGGLERVKKAEGDDNNTVNPPVRNVVPESFCVELNNDESVVAFRDYGDGAERLIVETGEEDFLEVELDAKGHVSRVTIADLAEHTEEEDYWSCGDLNY